MEKFQVSLPENRDQLLAALGMATPRSRFLSGGTDLIIALREGRITADRLIDLSGLAELSAIREENGQLVIGPMCTFNQIAENEQVNKHFTCLVEAAGQVGSNQIRNRATIGGNLANASPTGDTLPVLAMLQARAVILDGQGLSRELTVDQLITGPGQNALSRQEVITGIKIPLPGSGYRSTFVKLGTRSTVTIAMINGAMGITLNEQTGEVVQADLFLGAISTRPVVVPEIDSLLKKHGMERSVIAEMTTLLSDLIARTSPVEFDRDYKKEAVRGFARDMLANLLPEKFNRNGLL